MNEKWTNKTNK